MSAPRSLIMLGGSVGGIGKSTICMLIVDWLTHAKGASVLVVESDDSNPDVGKMYQPQHNAGSGSYPRVIPLNLDIERGWGNLVDACETHPLAHVIVNGGARNIKGLRSHSRPFLEAVAQEGHRRVTMLWVITPKRDCVEVLTQYRQACATPHVTVHVVCNCKSEKDEEFELYENSGLQGEVHADGGRTIRIAPLGSWARVEIDTHRRQITHVVEDKKQFRLSVRTAMSRWRNAAWKEFETLNLIED